ncbi:MAG: DUF2997 domain-containing protein [Phycisphaerales bacterium]|nr:DUF2997 domain-containing protein [Phycisphaerales bacterium]
MDHAELLITISASGQVMVEIKGAKGPRCLKYAELLKELVGHEVRRSLTREYYEPDQQVRFNTELHQRRADG